MISFTDSGSFDKTEAALKRMQKGEAFRILGKYGQEGVNALSNATPIRTGATAASWSYQVKQVGKTFSITWSNSYTEGGAPIAVLIQYGHGTKNGGYVQGRDYINPALRPVFDRLADAVWKEVTR